MINKSNRYSYIYIYIYNAYKNHLLAYKIILFIITMMLFLIGGSKAAFAQSYYAYGNGGTWNGASTYFLHTDGERYFYTPPAPSMSNATFLGYMPSYEATCGGLQEMLRAMPYDTVWDILYKIYNDIPNEYSFQNRGVYFTAWNGVE